MSVHQLPDGRWICKFPAGTIPTQPKKTKEYFGRGPEGERAAIQRNAEIGVSTAVKNTTSPLFSELADKYLAVKMQTATSSTVTSLKYKIDSIFFPALGHLQVHELTHQALDKFVAARRKSGVKGRTIRDDITYIRAVINFAMERHLIASHYIGGYQLPRDDSEHVRPPNRAEFEAIVAHAASHIKRAMWIAYFTGCRPGPIELFGLTWRDVDFFNGATGTITITSAEKGGVKTREIPIADRFLVMLQAWLEEDKASGKPIKYLIHYKGGKVASIRTGWDAAKARAGITRRIRRYDLRHMTAGELLAAGVDIKTISEILGNTPEQCMKAYLHVRSPQKKNAVDKL